VNIILFGPPGAGKGTQAENITKTFNLHKISTGDLLRNEILIKSELGNKIKSIINKGSFVSDNIINDLISKVLSNKDYYNRLIFDGYPRNLEQAKNLELLVKNNNQKISCVFSLNVDKDSVLKRILGRLTCTKCGEIFNKYFKPADNKKHLCDSNFLEKRSDDNEKTVLKRYQTYLDKTLPILDYYKDLNLLYEIDGGAKINEIFAKISHIIASLEAWLYKAYLYK